MFKIKPVRYVVQLLPLAMAVISVGMILFSGSGFTVENLLSYTPANFWLAAIYLLFMFAVKSLSFLLPISVLYVAVGTIFSIGPALLINTLGTAICILLGYVIGYYSGSEYADKMMTRHQKLKSLVEKQRRNEWFVVYFLRVCPISCDIVSIYLGSLKTSFHTYFIAGMIGCIPGIISSTLLGVSIEDPFSPMCIVSASMIVVLSVASYVVYKYIIKRKERESADPSL